MRLSSRQLVILAIAGLGSAKPFPRDDLHDLGYSYLMPRACDSYCGSDNQYCCGSNEVCQTADGVANCVKGYIGAFTTTWTETKTYTSTIMTRWEPAPEPTVGVDCVPKNDEQEACGYICCAGWQTCAFDGQCSAKPGYDEPTAVIITSDGKVTTRYSAPYRVTGTTTITTSGVQSTETETGTETTSEATATSTSDEAAAGEGSTSGGGLSAGAIAGIVIGSVAGVALLLLLCFCCIARGLWIALFGKKDKKDSREQVDIVEERYSRHGSRPPPSAYSRKSRMSGAPSAAGDRREKKSSGKKWLGIAGLAATLLALLNLKKDKRPASTKPARSSRGSSRYSDSYYSYSDYTGTSPSSSSSGGRTHRTRRTRDSRSRSYYSRSPRP
ncbi:hypothetical protein LCI18_009742 [Fusarium solani-melongenae]|uniref:Uncharacterized protein n=1 Tax=Fusarium solani subsp. cucurbitae TaxID=2747967 RepID=A0ACD3ZC80_FUSSC|nr:hypothetical protein LCI18_009742 [Fusarium solani-melongenae]